MGKGGRRGMGRLGREGGREETDRERERQRQREEWKKLKRRSGEQERRGHRGVH